MKFLLLVIFLFGFATHQVFADTEITGMLRIMDSYSTGPGPHPYIFWFTPDNQNVSYQLNPNTISSSVLDWAGERVTVKVPDNAMPLATSINPGEQFLDITSIKLVPKPLAISIQQIPLSTRSVTLLSKYSDIAATPSEPPNTAPGQFNSTRGVAVDGSGNIYVADYYNFRIQKFDANGNFLLTFGKFGSGNGQFKQPYGIAVDSLNNIIVADTFNNRIQKFDSNGVFLLKFGAFGGNGASGSGDGQFNQPLGVTVDSSNNIIVADKGNNRIQKFDSNGTFLLKFGVFGGGNGQFANPYGVAVDTSNNIYVADTGVNRIQKFDSSGVFQSKFGIVGSGDSQFSSPKGVAVDTSNNIYVADTGNNRIQKFNSANVFQGWLGKCTSGSNCDTINQQSIGFTCTALTCSSSTSGSGNGQFNSPEGVFSGSIFVSDTSNNRIKKFDTNGVFQFAIGFDGSLSHDQAYYQGIFYDNPGSLKQYYLKSSYNKFTWNGTVSGWANLPHPQATYATNPSNFDLMITDAIAAHEIVNFCNPTPVTNLILIFNGPVFPSANTAFGSVGHYPTLMGGTWSTEDGCNIDVSVSWEPDNVDNPATPNSNENFFCCGQTQDRGIGVTAHELGHNLGFLHTPPPPGLWVNAGPYSDPYHDPNSVMSKYSDREAPTPLIAPQRDEAGWMAVGNKIDIVNGQSQQIDLDFINEPEGGTNKQMITVPLPDGTSYIIEGHNEGLFSDTPQDKSGAIIYRNFPTGNQYAYLGLPDKGANYSLVATNGTDSESQFDTAMLDVGESYVDNTNHVTITTLSKTATSVTVSVSNNASACSPPAGLDWTITSSCTLSQNVTADKNVLVSSNSVLTIPNGKTLFFHASTYHITVQSGSGVKIQLGGSIKSIP
jgi:M6 family metalloprotease-like protein